VLAAVVLAAAALLFSLWREAPRLFGPEELELGVYGYSASNRVACARDSRPGPAGISPSEETDAGFRYTVKTPANYDAIRAHPLIVVYAPRGVNRTLSERFVGLTRRSTTTGFVIAYADSHQLTLRVIAELAEIPERIAERWCIDERRIHLTGHSDGGTVATAAALLGKMRLRPASIAPSAAGFRREDLSVYLCPPPTSVMVMQNRSDTLFPGYGRGAAEWWAACNGCDSSKPEVRQDGCIVYPRCKDGVATLFCEGEGAHRDWPRRNQAMLELFRSSAAGSKNAIDGESP
jgi:polyhydroxybutyrate depolymerase